jgi:glutathione reductase (NADPH)
MAEALRDSRHYGFATPANIPFDFATFKKKRDADILSLNHAYESNWSREGITLVHGTAKFISRKTLSVELEDGSGEKIFKGKHICIATGGYPIVPQIEGAEFGITNEGFFALEELPKRIAIVGAGYIAVEMAGMLNAIGVEVHMFIREEKFLRSFDPMISETMTARYESVGVMIHRGYNGFQRVENLGVEGGEKILKLVLEGGDSLEVNELLWAVGRSPETKSLELEKVGVKIDEQGCVVVDKFQNTSVEGVYALGDVTGQLELTPGLFSFFVSCLVDVPDGMNSGYCSGPPPLEPPLRPPTPLSLLPPIRKRPDRRLRTPGSRNHWSHRTASNLQVRRFQHQSLSYEVHEHVLCSVPSRGEEEKSDGVQDRV